MRNKKYLVIGIYLLVTIIFPISNIVFNKWSVGLDQYGSILLISFLLPIIISIVAIQYVIKSVKPKWSTLLIILIISATYSFYSNNDASGSLGFFLGPVFDKTENGTVNIYTLIIPLGAIYYLIFDKKD